MATDILVLLQWRFDTKKFDKTKKLSKEKINLLKEAFNLTATSYGLQPLKMVVVKRIALCISIGGRLPCRRRYIFRF